ncbi:MAG: HEAT repeat domain-containing protein [Planctomycetaceae bacterium]
MRRSPTALVTRLRALLDRLVESREMPKNEMQAVADEVAAAARALPREGLLEALDKAIGRSQRRRREAVYLLTEWQDLPAAAEKLGQWLYEPDETWRRWLVQVVGENGMDRYCPQLAEIIANDPDAECRAFALHSAARLRCPQALPMLLRLAEESDGKQRSGLVWALKEYATEDCRPHLERSFSDSQPKGDRVVAAWGLGKFGDQRAIAYLIAMLDEQDESLRAAQALCDIHGWPFEWHADFVAKTKERTAGNA